MVCGALAAPAYNMFGTGLGNGYSTGYSTGGGLLGGSFLGGSGLNGGAFGNTPNLVGRSLYPNTQLGGSVWPNTQNFATGGLYNQNMLPYNSAYGTNRNGMLNVNPMGVQNTGFGIAQTSMQDALLMQNPVVKNLLRSKLRTRFIQFLEIQLIAKYLLIDYQSNGLPLDQFIFDLNSGMNRRSIRLFCLESVSRG